MMKLKTNGTARRGQRRAASRIALVLMVTAMALGGATRGPATAAATAVAPAAPTHLVQDLQDGIAQPAAFDAAATAVIAAPATEPAAVTATSEEAAASEATASTAHQTVAAPPVAPAAPVAVAPAPAAPVVAAAGCEVAFCYPRVGIAGGIAQYSDCTGKTDIGTRIVQLNCTTPTYLMGHAYTQFGRIVNWQAGDEVWVYGTRYIVYGAVITHCGAWPPPAGVLRMQTSLSSGCGDVLVVLAR